MIVRTDRERGALAVYSENPRHAMMAEFLQRGRPAQQFQEGLIVRLPWEDDVVRTLCANGVEGTHWYPLFRDYNPPLVEGRFVPMPHQLATAAFLAWHPRAFCTSTMRTGKTASVALALDYLRGRSPGAALVVCPVSVMRGVWERTLRPLMNVRVLCGTRAQRLEALADPRAGAFVINYDGLKIIERELAAAVASGRITKAVIDELSHYGNATTQRWKAANRVFNSPARPVGRLWGLTGTPGADTLAVHGYVALVNPVKMPWQSRGKWQTAVQYKWGREAWMWKDRPEAAALVRDVMQPNIRFRKEDVLENLPPVMRTRRDAELSPEQERMARNLRTEMCALTAGKALVTADQKSALISKLFQTAAGSVISTTGTETLDCQPRIGLILELVASTSRKTVIFCSYRGVVDGLAAALRKAGVSVMAVHGGVTGSARDRIFAAFQQEGDPRVLVAHPTTTAYGTELAAADQLILNGPPLQGAHTYMQGLERLSSAKQTSDRISIVEVAAIEEERLFFDALDARTGTAEAVASLFDRITGGER
jgi:hypothetical protein